MEKSGGDKEKRSGTGVPAAECLVICSEVARSGARKRRFLTAVVAKLFWGLRAATWPHWRGEGIPGCWGRSPCDGHETGSRHDQRRPVQELGSTGNLPGGENGSADLLWPART